MVKQVFQDHCLSKDLELVSPSQQNLQPMFYSHKIDETYYQYQYDYINSDNLTFNTYL